MPSVTIGFVPRERFSLAAESLKSIYENDVIPFELIIVDCDTPREYWEQIEKVLNGRENVKVIRTDEYLLPNQAKNLVICEAKGDYLCLIENDNLVLDGWLTKLISACEEHPADIAVPLIFEGRPGSNKVHFDDELGYVRTIQTPDGRKIQIIPRTPTKQSVGGERRAVEFIETHCILFKRRVFDRIGLFDEDINTSEEVDLSLAVHHARVQVVFEPKSIIHFVLPTFPLPPGDQRYFLKKWNVEQARKTHERIQHRWNLARFPQLIGFVEERNLMGSGSLGLLRRELLSHISYEEVFIVVGLEDWLGCACVDGLKALPFLERGGKYWGEPEDDNTAIRELIRMRKSGASLIVFPWHSFWYLDYYSSFNEYLHHYYICVINNDHFIAYDLRKKSEHSMLHI